MAHDLPHDDADRGVPPLLPWQPCLLAYGGGILGLAYPLPALAGLALLALFVAGLRPRVGSWKKAGPGSWPTDPKKFFDCKNAVALLLGRGMRPGLPALVAAFALGLGAGWLALPATPDAPPCLAAKPVTAVGRVTSVDPRPGRRLALVLDEPRLSGQDCADTPLPGRLAVTFDHPDFTPIVGDILAVTGRIRSTAGFANPGTTDFAFLRRLEGVFFRAYAKGGRGDVTRLAASDNPLAIWRQALRDRVAAALFPPVAASPEASPDDSAASAGRAMVAALLFDDKSGFTETDLDLVRRASLAHTLALSGMNVAYVVGLAAALVLAVGRLYPGIYLRLPRQKLIVPVAAPLVVAYCWIGGGSPSLLRAALMFAAFGLMLLMGRDKALFDGLFLALAAFLVVSPLAVYSSSLQLSALAVAGISLFWPPFARMASRLPGHGTLARSILVGGLGVLWTSLSAEAAVLPLIARLFGDFAFAPWINLLWLPILGCLVMPLVLCGAAAAAVPGLDAVAHTLLTAGADCCAWLMRALAALDARGLLTARAVLRPSAPELLGCYGLLAALALAVASKRALPRTALAVSLVLMTGPSLARGFAAFSQEVAITVLDVGQGQSVAVTMPGGGRLLIDAGGLLGSFDVGRAVVGAYLADGQPPRLEAAIASHPHSDHVKGYVSLLDRFVIGTFLDNGGSAEGEIGPALADVLVRRHIPTRSLAAGDSLDLGGGLALDVLHPGPDADLSHNNGSLILRLTRNGHGLALFPGDAEASVLRKLAASGQNLQADVLVLPHHGSSSSLSRRFYAAVAPKTAIASCGDTGHYPSAKVVEALARWGCPVLATKSSGAVTVRLGGDGAIIGRQTAREAGPP
ncbi:MAG: ComEC/Rec2-related protein [Solidesulfovibrio magneticus str. Maddingley MBC34]|uniref:ComEC/Rec2-related protein n=1 Tax=Solidesulfovibrio magneticus str. Maddingley MBC34 TaxID=1206767 RepID=K6GS08_9BACT|nr:MAG: ComEC/Rec2-related protein [Solidesulfovibrio magneticus str. Maddingley MBC34]